MTMKSPKEYFIVLKVLLAADEENFTTSEKRQATFFTINKIIGIGLF